MTRGDKLRQMDNESLADWLFLHTDIRIVEDFQQKKEISYYDDLEDFLNEEIGIDADKW